MDFEDSLITVKTVCSINAGEEVTINYNGDWDDEKKLWFDVAVKTENNFMVDIAKRRQNQNM